MKFVGDHNYWVRKAFLGFALFCFFGCKTEEIKKLTKPNIVFIFADDMTYTAMHALGNMEIKTPYLDKLVNEGTTFTHAYNMGGWNGAICVASRSMIISGRSIWDAQETARKWTQGKAMEQTWGRLMENAGYRTYMTGKWHVAAPADSVFQNVVHVRPGMPSDAWIKKAQGAHFKSSGEDHFPGYNRPLSENDTTWSPIDPKFGGFWEGGRHWSEVLKDDALGFISEAKDNETPFFMYLAFNAPHDPRQSPQEYLDKYSVEEIHVPESFLPMYPYKDSIGNDPSLRDEALAPFPRTPYAIKKHKQEYYALITHLDAQIGEILKGLEDSGIAENTYVIFTADHGLAVGRHGLMGKQSQFDHSIRAPFVIKGPTIPKDKRVHTDIYLQDAMATSLELAGVEKPGYVFFNSVLPLVKDGKKQHYNSIYGAYIGYQRMIRKNSHKLIVYPKLEKTLLFDMEKDSEEMNDLTSNSSHKDKARELFDDLVQLQKEMGDTLDISSARP